MRLCRAQLSNLVRADVTSRAWLLTERYVYAWQVNRQLHVEMSWQ